MNRDLRPLLEPRSIAVVGASETSRAGTNLVRNLLELGYAGRIYPVNPRYEQVLGLPCYPSVAAIPDDIESVAVGVAAKYVLPSLEEAVRKGARGAVITSTGATSTGNAWLRGAVPRVTCR